VYYKEVKSVKINKAVAMQYFNTKPYITATEPLYCSELKRMIGLTARRQVSFPMNFYRMSTSFTTVRRLKC